MGDLVQGDILFDQDGNTCVVEFAHPVMYDRPCYRVEFSDGSSIIADAEHLWTVYPKTARKNASRRIGRPAKGNKRSGPRSAGSSPVTLTTAQMIPNLYVRGEANYSIPVCGPIQCPERDLPVDPYVLGAWLGNGTTRSGGLTQHDDDSQIIDIIRSRGYEVNRNKGPYAWYILGLVPDLRAAGVLHNKHIPALYLRASVSQRLDLLQGLMDTDGTCGTNGRCEFVAMNENLAKGVLDLALGLGIKATMTTGVAKLNGKSYGTKYRISFMSSLPAFKLARKLARQNLKPHGRPNSRFISAIVPVESVPVRCIQVSSPSRLFLAGEQYIPTHNTATHLFLLEEESSRFTRKYVAGYIAQTHAKVEERYQEWLARWEAAGLVLDKKNKDQLRYIKLRPWGKNKDGWEVFFWSGDPSSVDNLRGPRLDRICVDEAGFICSGVKAAVWPMGYGRNAKKLITGTPKRGGMGFEWFKEVYDRGVAGEAGYVSFNCPTEAAPWNDPVVMMRERLALRSRLAPETKTVEEMEELDGVFVSSVGAVFENVDAVISIPILRIEDDGTLFIGKDPELGHLYIIGQDWGLIGDNSVSAVLDRHTKEQVALRVEPLNLDYDTQILHLDQLHRRYNKAMIVGDGQGVGAYMGSTLLPKKYGAAYMDVKLTYGGVHDKGAYVTRMRRLFQSGEWKLLNVPALREQFVSFRSKPMGGNRNGLIYGAPEGSHDDIVLAVLYASIMLELTVPSQAVAIPAPGRFTYDGVADALKRKRNSDARSRGNWMPGARS